MSRSRMLPPSPDLREALAAAMALAAQCKTAADVWRSHSPAGYRVMPVSRRDSCLKNGMRPCYSVGRGGGVLAYPRVPNFDQLFNDDE